MGLQEARGHSRTMLDHPQIMDLCMNQKSLVEMVAQGAVLHLILDVHSLPHRVVVKEVKHSSLRIF